jgi:DNA sulfur modification protein DndD
VRLLSLKLNNFRQFKGESPELEFGGPGERPVTLFFGTNGAGKTALLNAFTWTLYGTTSRGFLLGDKIVNNAAIREAQAGDQVEAWVEIRFEHLGFKYVLRKTSRVRRGPSEAESPILGDPVAELQYAGPDGRWRPETSIKDAIGRVLPEDLHTYFFFDGERIERLVQPQDDERADIANATKKLFSLEILERAIRHLSAAKRNLESEYQRIGDAQTVQLLGEKRSIEEQKGSVQKRLRELETNIHSHRKTDEEVQNRLRTLHAARELQVRRDGLRRDMEARTSSLRQVTSELASLMSVRAYTVFVSDACKSYHEIVSAMRQRGELPSGIKRQFVEDLLERNRCICGRSLGHTDASEHRAVVEGWKERAGLQDVEEKAIRMGAEVKLLEQQTGQFWAQLDQFQERRRADREELSRIQQDLDAISLQLRQSGEEELGALEARLVSTKSAIERDLLEKGSCTTQIKQFEDSLADIETKLAKHQATEAKQQLAQRRLNAARDVIERITESKQRFESKFRNDLTKRVRSLFDAISFTPYVPEITEDYALRLRESAGGMPLPVAASQGESQILSLCFIGGVISLARDYQARKERLPGPDSSQFPLVMDSPFGSLGPTYRRQVADHITTLADQVIIMVTNTQWRGEVEQSLRNRMGKAYVLQYYSPKQDITPETVEVGGAAYDLIKVSPNEFEYTTLIEVPHA